jgi:hypothetical protein
MGRSPSKEFHQMFRRFIVQKLILNWNEPEGIILESWRSFLPYNTFHYSSRHQIACFKVITKSYNVATRTAEPRQFRNRRVAKLATLYWWRRDVRKGVCVCVCVCEVLPWPWSMQFGDGYYNKTSSLELFNGAVSSAESAVLNEMERQSRTISM